MMQSPAERNIRVALPMVRLMTAYIPIWVARWTEKRASAHVGVPADITHEVISANGARCEWFIPKGSVEDKALVYLHGGGFIYGMTQIHRQMIVALARRMNMRVLMVDYRVAPEHPFPAALDDCVTAYRWLLKQGVSAHKIAIAGDSAGGNLTIATLLKLRDTGDPLPAVGACLSPVIDLTDRGSLLQQKYDPLLHPKAMKTYSAAYVASSDPRDPYLSPAFADWHGLPPLLIHVGEDEILRDDALRAERLARAAGVEVKLSVYPRMWHVWQLNLDLPQSSQSLDDIAQFLNAHLESTIRA
jgi:epsilon-lactone hydrolase